MDKLVDWLEAKIAGKAGDGDLLDQDPSLTKDDAYRLQFALMDRKSDKGERILGYKAAHTSLAIQQEREAEVSVGTLLDGFRYKEHEEILLPAGVDVFVEPEIAVLLKRDLAGADVTWLDAMRAVEGVMPAIEVVTPARGKTKRSRQMAIARGKTEGGYILGGTLTPLSGLDLRLEGAVISVNGVPNRSGAGVEAMGSPLNVLVTVAHMLARYDRGLKAGMIVMTGSLTNNVPVGPGDAVTVEMTRLGSVSTRFAAQ